MQDITEVRSDRQLIDHDPIIRRHQRSSLKQKNPSAKNDNIGRQNKKDQTPVKMPHIAQ